MPSYIFEAGILANRSCPHRPALKVLSNPMASEGPFRWFRGVRLGRAAGIARPSPLYGTYECPFPPRPRPHCILPSHLFYRRALSSPLTGRAAQPPEFSPQPRQQVTIPPLSLHHPRGMTCVSPRQIILLFLRHSRNGPRFPHCLSERK